VFCANDLLALGLLQQAVRLGLRVPEDLAQAQGVLSPGSRDLVLEPELVVRDSTRLSRTRQVARGHNRMDRLP
jgi:Periplasmic binding protein-like domain